MATSQQWLTLLSILHHNTDMFTYIEPEIMVVLRSYYDGRDVTELECAKIHTNDIYMLRAKVKRSNGNERIHVIACVGNNRPLSLFSEELNHIYGVIKKGVRQCKIDTILQ